MKKFIGVILMLFISVISFAQQHVEMADGLRSSGKIYVVIGGLVTILLGILLFLILIDRKVGDIEKKINKK